MGAQKREGRRRRLIVCADDFGMSPGVNAAVLRAHCEGIVTEASLMVTGAAAAEAVAMALRTPTLGVGLHLVLAQGYPVSPPHAVPDLVDGAGMFPSEPVRLGLRYFFAPGLRESLEREIAAQLERFRDSGLPLSHVDGHLTLHVHPVVLDILCSLKERFGIRAMRLPIEPLRHTLSFDRRAMGRRAFEGLVFSILGRYARARMRRHGICHPDRMYGMHQSGHISEAYLLHLIPRLGPGTTELYCHPAVADEEVRRWTPDYDRGRELAALTSPRVRAAIDAAGIELIRYCDL